jgi:putative ABC transport system permease protein
MLRNHLLILYRNLNKNRLFFFINVLGLSIAIGCCVVTYFNYDFNASFDSVHAKASSIYRVNSIRQGSFSGYGLQPGKASDAFAVVPTPLGDALRQNLGDIVFLSRYSRASMDVRAESDIFKTNAAYVDGDFFQMFTFNFIHGSAEALTDKSKIVISDQLATKYYNHTNVVGKVLTYLVSDSVKKELEIVGVYTLPKINSSFNRDLYSLYDNYWEMVGAEGESNWKDMNTLFVLIPEANKINAIEKQINVYVENNNKAQEDFLIQEFKLDPFVGMAARDAIENRPGRQTRAAHPVAANIALAVLSILILVIACFNLANTAIALSQKRLKEIGLRKVMGSVRRQLIFQYISETMVICFLAMLVGLWLAEAILLPAFNDLWPFMKLETHYLDKPDFIVFMVIILFITGLLAGSYPAFYVSKFNPVQILKGKLQFGGNNMVTYFLLSVQLILSLCAIVCGLAFADNARWQRDFDNGFSEDTGIVTYVNSRADFDAFRNALSGIKEIVSITGSPHDLQSGFYHDKVKHKGQELESIIMNVGDDYIKTTGMVLLEGRDFGKDSESDRKESVIITEEFARLYSWDSPVGKQVIWKDSIKLYVIGVVKDIYSVWEPLEPMMMRYAAADEVNYVLVKAAEGSVSEVDAYMKAKWKATFPNRIYESRFMNSGDAEADMVNKGLVIIFFFLGGVALLLSGAGLFTLVSLNIIKRMKEIGVRMLFGASMANILRITNMEFAIIVPIATALGSYAGVLLSEVFMNAVWDRHKEPTSLTMVISCIIALVVCVLSVTIKTHQTTKLNPADVLKDE